jgi:chromosome segregation ATPase
MLLKFVPPTRISPVHIAKTELEARLELLQTKEQAADDASIHSSSIKSLHETLESLDKRLETHMSVLSSRQDSLDKKIDQLTICSEKNSEALSQVHISISAVLFR